MKLNDETLVQAYISLGKSADKIAAFPRHRRDFLDRLAIEDDDGKVIWHLLLLRKTGKLPKMSSRRS